MFSREYQNITKIGVGQYWPTWAFYSMKDQSFNNLPLNIIPLNSSPKNPIFKQNESLPSKLGFMEWKPQEQLENQNNLDIQKNCYENDLSENQSSFTCKKKKPSSKKNKLKRGPQNKNRNVLPSIVQQIFSFISKPTKSKEICQQIFNTLPQTQNTSIQKYYGFMKAVKQKLDHYVNQKSLNVLCRHQQIGIGLFSQQQQQFYLRLGRIITKYFLVNHLPFLAIHSKRMSNDKKIEHFKVKRVLIKILQNMTLL